MPHRAVLVLAALALGALAAQTDNDFIQVKHNSMNAFCLAS